MVKHIVQIFDKIYWLTYLDKPWQDQENLSVFANAVHDKGAPLHNYWGFRDGTLLPGCLSFEAPQETTFGGHTRLHCISKVHHAGGEGGESGVKSTFTLSRSYHRLQVGFCIVCKCMRAWVGELIWTCLVWVEQSTTDNGDWSPASGTPSECSEHYGGILTSCWDVSWNRNFVAVARESGWTWATTLCLSGFCLLVVSPADMHIQKGSVDTPRRGILSSHKPHKAIRWVGFSDITIIFAFLDFRNKIKALSPINWRLYKAATILTNCRICLYGNRTSQCFPVQSCWITISKFFLQACEIILGVTLFSGLFYLLGTIRHLLFWMVSTVDVRCIAWCIFSSAWVCQQSSWYWTFVRRPSVRRPCRNFLWT